MYISAVNYESVSDTNDGMATTIFISGCRHHCEGCHNQQSHDFKNGILLTEEVIHKINNEIRKRPYVTSIVLSGGDPMYSAKEICEFLLPNLETKDKTIWCYSGFTYEEILQNDDMRGLLDKCEVLVDGKFDITKRNVSLICRGSSNQRIFKKFNGTWKQIID